MRKRCSRACGAQQSPAVAAGVSTHEPPPSAPLREPTHLLSQVGLVHRLVVLAGQGGVPRAQLPGLALLGGHRLEMRDGKVGGRVGGADRRSHDGHAAQRAAGSKSVAGGGRSPATECSLAASPQPCQSLAHLLQPPLLARQLLLQALLRVARRRRLGRRLGGASLVLLSALGGLVQLVAGRRRLAGRLVGLCGAGSGGGGQRSGVCGVRAGSAIAAAS